MAKTINILPAVDVSNGALTVDVEITQGGHTHTQQFAFNADDFDCNCSSSSPYVAKFLFDPGDITMILEVQGDFTTCKFDGVTKASAYALAQEVIADIDQYKTAGGGGSYTFPTNHGNTAYVATGGNDGTGVVGNISKPFETLQAAIDALDSGSNGQVIILSSSGFGQNITSLSMGFSHPYAILIQNFADCDINFTGTGNHDAGQLTLITPKGVIFNMTGGAGAFNTDDYFNIKAKLVSFPSTFDASFTHAGTIECDVFTINANSNNPSLEFGYINWKYSLNINETITYQRCNPMVWKGRITQTGLGAPVLAQLHDNSMGETLGFARSDSGDYTMTSPNSKFSDKTNVRFSSAEIFFPFASPIFNYTVTTQDEIRFNCFDGVSFMLGDYIGQSGGTVIEIEIYP